MTKEKSRSGRILKGEKDVSSSKQVGEKGLTSGSASTDTAPGLRRSTRDTTPKKQSPASSTSSKNSERIETSTPQSTPNKRKSDRLEKRNMPSPLRRSDKDKDDNNHSLSVSGSKNSEKGSSSFENRNNEEQGGMKSKVLKGCSSNKMSAVKYRATLLKTQAKKDKSDKKFKVHYDLPQGVSLEKGAGCSLKVGHGIKVEEVRGKLPSYLTTVELSEKVGSKRIKLEMSASSAPREDREICASTADVVLKEVCVPAPVLTSLQNGEMSENCIQKDGSEHAVHRRSKDNTETSCEGQRKPPCDQTVCPAETENIVHLKPEEDGGKRKARLCRELSEECCTGAQLRGSPLMKKAGSGDNVCVSCEFGGTLLCCDGKGCKKSYHLQCLDPPLKDVPIGVWHCVTCVKKKMESGVHSVSGGVESILGSREVELADSEGVQKQYLVKYRCLAHVHNRWVPESRLLLEAPVLVGKFRKNQAVRWKPEWAVPERLLLKRLLMSPKQQDEYLVGSDIIAHFEWFVKWSDLGYDDATWELESEPFLRTPEAMKLMKDYECRLEKAKMASDPSKSEKEAKGSFFKLLELPGECQPEFDNDHLCSVNKLREYWHKGQSAVFMEDQERVIRVILFILSLQFVVRRPFLLVSTAFALSAWEAGFLRLAPSLDVIVYSGSRDARKSIRMLEFYVDGCSVMFQVLLAPLDAIVEDIELINCVSWEAIIVDECHLSNVSKSLENIKLLTTYFKLLLVNGPMKDSLVDYRHLLSFLGSGNAEEGTYYCKNDANDSVEKLKERLAWFVASVRKSDSSKFVEYWVPVKLSNVQLEQYCYTLLANSAILRSCSKNIVEDLRNVLLSTRKCCDHPYLVDPPLQKLLTNGLPVTEYLNVGVKASGKLQVLDKILFEIKEQGLRVLILFQSIGGSGTSLGDFLDDVVRQRFGEDSYERVDGGLATSKKQAAMNKFNDKEKGRMVFLLERRACNSSIKLSSVDIVILYDSDWNPYNDLKVLQKITIDSRLKQLKMFRLYSSYTLEEKALIHAKQVMTMDSNIQNLNNSTIHMLLRWGASHLFKELKEFHDSSPSSGSIDSEQSLTNLVKELFSSLPQDAGTSSTSSSSIVVKVNQTGGIYSRDICLPDDLEMQSTEGDPRPPHVFWAELLERRIPEWRYLSSGSPSQRARKRVQYFDGSPNKTGSDNDVVAKKRRKLGNSTIDAATDRSVVEEKRKKGGANKEGASQTPADNGTQLLASPVDPMESARFRNVNDILNIPACVSEPEKRSKSLSAPKDRDILLKPEISELCDIFLFPEDVKEMAGGFLEYISNNHRVPQEQSTVVQAFKIALCWVAASFLNHKIDQAETLRLAKQHLNFECKEEVASSIYGMLKKQKKLFLRQAENVKQSTSGGEPARVADNTKPDRPACAQSKIPGQQDLEGGEISGTPESQHSNESVTIKQLATNSEEAIRLPNNEISKNISLVNKIYAERWVKLVAYQTKESNEFKEERDKIEKEQLAALEKAHKFESALVRSLHKNSVGVEKLKIADQDFKKRKDIIKNHMDSEQKKLELLHDEAKNKEKNLKNHWSLEAKSGRPVDSFSTLPQSLSSYFKLETLQLNEQDPSKEPITDRTGSPGLNEMGVTKASETVRGESAVEDRIPIECPESFVQSTGPLPSTQYNGGTSVVQLDVQFQLKGLEPSEEGPQEDLALDRIGSLGDSVMGDAGPSEGFQGHIPVAEGTIPAEPLDNVNSTFQSTDSVPYKQSNYSSSVPSVQFHPRDSERSEQGPSGPITDTTDSLRLTEMGVAGSSGTVLGHVPVVMGTPTKPSENLVESTFQSIGSLPCNRSDRSEDATVATLPDMQHQVEDSDLSNQGPLKESNADPTGSLVPNEARVREVSETIHGHEQGALLTEQLPVSAPANSPSEPLLSNSSSHDTSVLSPATNLELHTPMDSLPSEQSRMPTGPSVESSTHALDTRSMTLSRTPQAPVPQDPLCYELARLRKEEEQVVKIHDELIMRINSDYEKEREEIQQKYSKLLHDVDTALAQKQKTYDTSISKVSMNRMLAEVFRFKCSETTRAAGPLASQQGGHPGLLHNHQSFHSPSHQNSQRSPLVSSAAISATPSTTVQQVTRHSSAPFYNNNMLVRPHFSSGGASMSASNQVGCRQSHAPHLQPFTPSTSMSSSPSQQPPYNSTTLPIPQLNNPAGGSSCLQLTGLPVNHGAVANSSLVIDSVMNDFDNFGLLSSVGGGSGSSNNLLPPVLTLDLSDLLGGPNASDLRGPATASSAGEVVCLSDDE